MPVQLKEGVPPSYETFYYCLAYVTPDCTDLTTSAYGGGCFPPPTTPDGGADAGGD